MSRDLQRVGLPEANASDRAESGSGQSRNPLRGNDDY